MMSRKQELRERLKALGVMLEEDLPPYIRDRIGKVLKEVRFDNDRRIFTLFFTHGLREKIPYSLLGLQKVLGAGLSPRIGPHSWFYVDLEGDQIPVDCEAPTLGNYIRLVLQSKEFDRRLAGMSESVAGGRVQSKQTTAILGHIQE